jgi:uncharacterized integral membrane protein (TIGR00698 family)
MSANPVLAASDAARTKPDASILYGVAVATTIATIAWFGGNAIPLIGAPVLAIVIGVGYRALWPITDAMRPGVVFSAKKILQAAIVISGFGLSFVTVVQTGLSTLPVTLSTIAVALGLAFVIGRLLGIKGVVRDLIGVGTAICGASAIAAVSTILEPAEDEMALAMATIFLFNIVAVLVFPPLGHLMHLTQAAFGVWAGTAINDTSSVVAAGYVYGHDAGVHATIVKLTRATFILPIVGIIAVARVRARSTEGARVPWMRIIPWFIVWFLGAALVNTTGLVPAAWHAGIAHGATFLISIALAAIGLQTQLGRLMRAGARPLAFGFILWVAVAVTSLLVQHATGL